MQSNQARKNQRDATIFFTSDGSTPSEQSTRYADPCLLEQTGAVVKAIVHIQNKGNSKVVAVGPFDIMSSKPIFVPAAGLYVDSAVVYLHSKDLSARIFYTTDGSKPSTASKEYVRSEGILVENSSTINAIAKAEQLSSSDV